MVPFGWNAAAHGCETMVEFPVGSRTLMAAKRFFRPAMTPFGSFGFVCTSARCARSTTLTAGKSVCWNWKGCVGARISCVTQDDVPAGRPGERPPGRRGRRGGGQRPVADFVGERDVVVHRERALGSPPFGRPRLVRCLLV